MADYGIKIAKPGKSVTSTTPQDYIFWSKLQTKTLFLKTSTSITLLAGSENASTTVYHNLGYIPKVWVFTTDCSSRYQKLPILGSGFGEGTSCVTCNKGDSAYSNLDVSIYTDRIVISLNAYCYVPQGSQYAPLADITLPLDIFVFMEKIA